MFLGDWKPVLSSVSVEARNWDFRVPPSSAECNEERGSVLYLLQTPPDDPGNPSVDFHGERRTTADFPNAEAGTLVARLDTIHRLRMINSTPICPLWGERFYGVGQGKRGEVGIGEIIGKIVAYLETIQDRRRAMR